MSPGRLLILALLALFGASTAQAHPLLQDAMWVLFGPEKVRLAVNVSARELAVAQKLESTGDDAFAVEHLAAAAERHRDYVVAHLHLRAGERELPGRVVQITPPPLFGNAEQTFFQFELEYPLGDAKPDQIAISHEMLREFPYAPGESWDVTYVMRIKRAGSDEVESALLRAGAPLAFATGAVTPVAAQTRTASARSTFAQYLLDGVMHILTGYDHLLFVSALVLATLTFWEMVKVIAAFTAAHTLTLTLAAFDLVRMPSWIVEPVIAASIVFVAVENIVWPSHTHSRLRLAVAFGFGLVHGLGFAGGLLEAMEGLPAISLGLAIVAFSIGVELGHQVVVLPLFGLLRLGHGKWEAFRPFALRWGSAAISLCGVYYFVHAVLVA